MATGISYLRRHCSLWDCKLILPCFLLVHLKIKLVFFLGHTTWLVGCGILVRYPGPSAVRAQSPNRWTAREFPKGPLFKGPCDQFSPQQTFTLSLRRLSSPLIAVISHWVSSVLFRKHLSDSSLRQVNPTLFTCYYKQCIPCLQVDLLQNRPQGVLSHW